MKIIGNGGELNHIAAGGLMGGMGGVPGFVTRAFSFLAQPFFPLQLREI
jgi:hypothetical protein